MIISSCSANWVSCPERGSKCLSWLNHSPGYLFASFCIYVWCPELFSSSILVPLQEPWHPPSPLCGCDYSHVLQSHSYHPFSLLCTYTYMYAPQLTSSNSLLPCQCSTCHTPCTEPGNSMPTEQSNSESVSVKLSTKLEHEEATLTKGIYKAVKYLKWNTEIVILPADKGNATVVMDHSEYTCMIKMNKMLKDSTYHQLRNDPTNKVETRVSQALEIVEDNNSISVKEKSTFTRTVLNHPRSTCVWSPKIHKENIPLCQHLDCPPTWWQKC